MWQEICYYSMQNICLMGFAIKLLHFLSIRISKTPLSNLWLPWQKRHVIYIKTKEAPGPHLARPAFKVSWEDRRNNWKVQLDCVQSCKGCLENEINQCTDIVGKSLQWMPDSRALSLISNVGRLAGSSKGNALLSYLSNWWIVCNMQMRIHKSYEWQLNLCEP